MLVTSGCWWLYLGDNFWILVTEFRYWWHLLDVDAQRLCYERMLVTKTAKTVTNISKLSATHFVSNIRHQHRCRREWAIETFQKKYRLKVSFVKGQVFLKRALVRKYKTDWPLTVPIIETWFFEIRKVITTYETIVRRLNEWFEWFRECCGVPKLTVPKFEIHLTKKLLQIRRIQLGPKCKPVSRCISTVTRLVEYHMS